MSRRSAPVYFDSETGMLKRRFMDGTETPEIDPPHCEPPQLMVVAGPNGSGKSTISAGLPIPGLYSNTDDMKHMLGCRDLEAAQMVEKVRLLSLWKRTDFSFETVLSTARYLNLLQQAKVAGYQIAALFVLTRDPEINVSRVRARAAAGGHDVPEEKIRSRYQRSLQICRPLQKSQTCSVLWTTAEMHRSSFMRFRMPAGRYLKTSIGPIRRF